MVRRLLQHGAAMHQAASVVAELDCLVSFALAARELNYCRCAVGAHACVLTHASGGGLRVVEGEGEGGKVGAPSALVVQACCCRWPGSGRGYLLHNCVWSSPS